MTVLYVMMFDNWCKTNVTNRQMKAECTIEYSTTDGRIRGVCCQCLLSATKYSADITYSVITRRVLIGISGVQVG